jgi:thioredoxin 1
MSKVILNEQNFDQEVLSSDKLVLVDFWAEWCGPCKILGPIIDELATQYEGKMLVGKVDVDANNSLSGRYNIMSIPTMKFFKAGKQVGEIIGAAPKAMIETELKKHL